VFPRNQFSKACLQIWRDCGLDIVRGNQSARIYQYDHDTNESLGKRALRRLDQYLPLTGPNCVAPRALPERRHRHSVQPFPVCRRRARSAPCRPSAGAGSARA
jgi:hypothetical protein